MKVKEKLESGELNNPILLTDVNSTIRSLEAENKRFLDEHSKSSALELRLNGMRKVKGLINTSST